MACRGLVEDLEAPRGVPLVVRKSLAGLLWMSHGPSR